mgnify:CR=1 FL=1
MADRHLIAAIAEECEHHARYTVRVAERWDRIYFDIEAATEAEAIEKVAAVEESGTGVSELVEFVETTSGDTIAYCGVCGRGEGDAD